MKTSLVSVLVGKTSGEAFDTPIGVVEIADKETLTPIIYNFIISIFNHDDCDNIDEWVNNIVDILVTDCGYVDDDVEFELFDSKLYTK